MAADEGGLLGDLPRSRPGTRSPKRGPRTRRSTAGGTPARTGQGVSVGETATQPLRLAVGAAEAGLKVASRLTGEVMRRFPRL